MSDTATGCILCIVYSVRLTYKPISSNHLSLVVSLMLGPLPLLCILQLLGNLVNR